MLSVIIPTYNEKESILSTIKEIKQSIDKITHEIIVVDDNSPDMTWKIVNEAEIKDTRCIRRKKKISLSSAVMHGFSEAKYEYLLVMDADGQHNPNIIKEMLKFIENHDFVNGSRFIKGGGVQNWSKKRLFVSKIAASIARPFLKTRISDPMSGYFMLKNKTYNTLQYDISEKGYKIFLDLIFAYERRFGKVKVKEIPFIFRTRKGGESKLGLEIVVNYMQMLLFCFIQKNKKILKIIFLSLITFIILIALFS